MDIADLGLKAYVIEDVTKSFDYGEAWPGMKKRLNAKGVGVVNMDGPEVGRVKTLGAGKGNGKQGIREIRRRWSFMATSTGLSSLGTRRSRVKD